MWLNSNRRAIKDFRQVKFASFAPVNDRNPLATAMKSSADCGMHLPSDCTVHVPLNNDFQNKIDGTVFVNRAYVGATSYTPTFVTQGSRKVGVFGTNAYMCVADSFELYCNYVWGKRNYHWKDETSTVHLNSNPVSSMVSYVTTNRGDYPYGSGTTGYPNSISFFRICKHPQGYYNDFANIDGNTFSRGWYIDMEFTAAFWCKYATDNHNAVPFSWQTNGYDAWAQGGCLFLGHRDNSKLHICDINDAGYMVDTNPSTKRMGITSINGLNDGAWHFVVARYKVTSTTTSLTILAGVPTVPSYHTGSKYLDMWIDNVFQDSTVNTRCGSTILTRSRPDGYTDLGGVNGYVNKQPFRIGSFVSGYVTASASAFHGNLAEVMFFTRYLGEDELTALYDRGRRVLGLV